jgi:hypothetical protein
LADTNPSPHCPACHPTIDRELQSDPNIVNLWLIDRQNPNWIVDGQISMLVEIQNPGITI